MFHDMSLISRVSDIDEHMTINGFAWRWICQGPFTNMD